MSLIEKAAQRLEDLRRAGVSTGERRSGSQETESGIPTPEAFVRDMETRMGAAAETTRRVAAGDGPPAIDRATGGPLEEVDASEPPGRTYRGPSGRVVTSRSVLVDLEGLKARGYVTPDVPSSAIADEFRVIKRPIIRNASGRAGAKLRDGNLVMITSSLPSEGKTFTAVNLAMSVAMEMDNTVLLVDGDVARPGLPRVLGIPESPGLLDLLTSDSLDVSDALVRTNVEKLTVLPAGTPHRRATELLASEQMTTLLRDLASRYPDRIIIFDSPPLLPTTEARVLATHMGQIVVVVAAESTSQNTLNQALATIESCEHVMMMLNKASRSEVGAYGYYPKAPRQ